MRIAEEPLQLGMFCRGLGPVVCAVFSCLGVAMPASAQVVDERTHAVLDSRTREILDAQSVTQRLRPEYDAVPLPLGGFDVFPSASFATSYNDNVLATDVGRIADAN